MIFYLVYDQSIFRYETVTLVEGLNGPLNPQIGTVDSACSSEQNDEARNSAIKTTDIRVELVSFSYRLPIFFITSPTVYDNLKMVYLSYPVTTVHKLDNI